MNANTLNRNSVFKLLYFTGLLLISSFSYSHSFTLGEISISHPWARETALPGLNGAVYVTINNSGASADRLVSVTTPLSKRAEIHENKMADGMMEMNHLSEGLVIPPQGTVKLEPAGFHIMLIKLEKRLEAKTHIPVTLVFEKAGNITINVAVQSLEDSPTAFH